MSDSKWKADRIPDLSGRTAIVTGANSGLGLATTRQLAHRGARVIMAVRNEAKGEQALGAVADSQPGASLELRIVDLADLDSVRAFAERLRGDVARVDILVNNAGVMMPPRSLSPQGHEIQFAANHLGHFALTGMLLDLLEAGTDPRVVTVSSLLHRRGTIRYDDLTGERDYSALDYYAQSKLANVLFGLELHRRLTARGSAVSSLIAHPGLSSTNLVANGPTGVTRVVGVMGASLVGQRADKGALPQLYAATESTAQGGQFIGPGGVGEWRGYPKVVRPAPHAENPESAARLWSLSEEITEVRIQ